MAAAATMECSAFLLVPQYVRVTYRGEIEEVMLINAGGVELERAKGALVAQSIERDFREEEERRRRAQQTQQEQTKSVGDDTQAEAPAEPGDSEAAGETLEEDPLPRVPRRESEAVLHYIGVRFEALLSQNPEDTDALYHWGLRLQEEADQARERDEEDGRLGILELACSKYAMAATIAPNFHEAYYNRGVALADIAAIHRTGPRAMEALREACTMYEKAIDIEWNNPQALNNWGLAQKELAGLLSAVDEKIDLLSSAVRHFRCAVRMQDDFHRAIYNLGAVLYAYGELVADSEEQYLLRKLAGVNLVASHCLQPAIVVYRDAVHLTRQFLPLPYILEGELKYLCRTRPSERVTGEARYLWKSGVFVVDYDSIRIKGLSMNSDCERPDDRTSDAAGDQLAPALMDGEESEIEPISSDRTDRTDEAAAEDSGPRGGEESLASHERPKAWRNQAFVDQSVDEDMVIPISNLQAIEPLSDFTMPVKQGFCIIHTAASMDYFAADSVTAANGWIDTLRLLKTLYNTDTLGQLRGMILASK
mmetsp:Transcript_8956/g.32973  ORF Transcript_8956/g.32973 Transcript_8956/m.32973 type:complete len:536 (+) Transcript_8956:379-1986(+)